MNTGIDFWRKNPYIPSVKFIKIFFLIVVVAVLLYFFFNNLNLKEVVNIIGGINPVFSIVFLIGLYIQFYIRAYRWGIILSSFKQKIPIFTLYNYIVIGFFINILVPGRVGEPARGILVADEIGIKKSHGLASVVLERMIDFLMIIVIFFSSLFFLNETDSHIFVSLKKGAFFMLPIVVFIFFIFYLINIKIMSRFVESVISFSAKLIPAKFRAKWIEALGNFIKGLKINLSAENYIKLLLSSFLVWIWLIPFYWFLMKGFDFGSSISIMQTVPYFSIIVVSAAIPTPGMTGSLDTASKYGLLELYGNNGIKVDEAAAYTLLIHILILIIIMLPGLIAIKTKGLKIKSILGIKEK